MKKVTIRSALQFVVSARNCIITTFSCCLLILMTSALNAQKSSSLNVQTRQRPGMNKSPMLIKNGLNPLFAPFSVQQADSITNPLGQIIQALGGPGVTISNVQTTLPQTSNIYGSFTGGTTVIGIESGLLMTSGSVFNAIGPNISAWTSQVNGLPGYLTIDTNGFDAAVISFDVVSSTNFLSFNYVFASEEYNEYVGSQFNDVFAFLISGPGIAPGTNIALIPGTSTPVDINDVNLLFNSQYYINNDSLPGADPFRFQNLEYDGLTKVLVTAPVTVTPGATYTITLVIQDVSDAVYDSGVFLQGGSITSDSCVMVLQAEKEDAGCNGSTNGSIDLTVAGANGMPHFLWTTGDTTEDISNLLPGSYNVVVTDDIGCTATLDSPVTIVAGTTLDPAGAISGLSKVCINQSGYIYTVPAVPNATAYEWTLPAGMSPSSGGLITLLNSISVNTGSGFTSGSIKVHGLSACGSGGDSPPFFVSKSTSRPPTPSPINGLTGTVYGYCAGNTYMFTTSSANAESFNWVTDAGTIIDGQGNDTILLLINDPRTGCTLTVTASNCGGVSGVRKLSIRAVLPPPVISGVSTVCKNTSPVQTYTVSSTGSPLSYIWSSSFPYIKFSDGGIPSNPLATISASVTVDFTAVPTGNRNVRVQAVNNCGTGAIRVKTVTVSNCIRTNDVSTNKNDENKILVFPNPVKEIMMIRYDAEVDGDYLLNLTDVTGRIVYTEKLNGVKGDNEWQIHADIAPGYYSVIIRKGGLVSVIGITKE